MQGYNGGCVLGGVIGGGYVGVNGKGIAIEFGALAGQGVGDVAGLGVGNSWQQAIGDK